MKYDLVETIVTFWSTDKKKANVYILNRTIVWWLVPFGF